MPVQKKSGNLLNAAHIYIVTPLCFYKLLLIVYTEFFLFPSCQHPGNLFLWTTSDIISSGQIVSSPICGFFKHYVSTEGIDKPTSQKRMW